MSRPSPFRPTLTALEDRSVPTVVLSDNLTNTTGGAETASGSRYLTSSFTTDSSAHTLNEVDLKLAQTAAGTAVVSVYSDATLQPGAVIGTLTSPAGYSATAATTAFTGAVALAANSTYWVVLSAPSGSFDWSWTTDNTGTGTGFTHTFGDSTDAGATWFTGDIYPTQMRVVADSGAVSPPATVPVVAFAAASTTVSEGAGTLTITLSRTGNTTAAETVAVTASGGTAVAGADYLGLPATASFAAGATTATITVTIIDNTVASGNKTLPLTLGTPSSGTVGAQATAAVVIQDNEATVPVSPPTTVTPPTTPTTPPTVVANSLTAVGQGSGGSAVNVYAADGTLKGTLNPFPGFTGGARVATVDVTGDGIDDIIVGAGPGGGPAVVVYSGATLAEVARFFAFEATFTGGVFVAGGDTDGDGKAEVVVTPDQGGGPVVAVYSGASIAAGQPATVARFFGIDDANFRGGARAAMTDLSSDRRSDLIVAAGTGGGPRVAIFDGTTLAGTPTRLVGDFFAFEDGLRNGAFVAASGGLVAFGGGPGGGPRVRAATGGFLMAAAPFANLDNVAAQVLFADFFAGDSAVRSGVRLAFGDATGDGVADLITGAGDSGVVRAYTTPALDAGNTAPAREFDAFGVGLAGGVYVG